MLRVVSQQSNQSQEKCTNYNQIPSRRKIEHKEIPSPCKIGFKDKFYQHKKRTGSILNNAIEISRIVLMTSTRLGFDYRQRQCSVICNMHTKLEF